MKNLQWEALELVIDHTLKGDPIIGFMTTKSRSIILACDSVIVLEHFQEEGQMSDILFPFQAIDRIRRNKVVEIL